MALERWSEVERIYHRTRAYPPEARAAILEQTCGGDDDLRREVESLLHHANGAEEYLDEAALEVAAQARDLSSISTGLIETAWQAGSVIGRYCLLRKVGEGGMGEVWLAEQQQPVRRSVALKLIKAGMNTREVMARFESERQALALMNHPAIAKVFDASSTPGGEPYFVMEYVSGAPVTVYCDDRNLNIRQRLELFVQVCEGVQHAHQKAIIHRDLKPSNILVIEVDGRPAPKIIDFGVAKAMTESLTADTLITGLGSLVGTPQYMSPEQANATSEGIDTRTDVYSLGVILYELLAGNAPLELRKIPLDEFLRRLREDQPARPSCKIATQDPSASVEIARKRRTEPVALAKRFRGDLDSIALKALEKDRSRRYGSPSDFAADIGRYLRNESVLAVLPSAAYRARKFGRRYRVQIAVAGAFALLLVMAAGISIWQTIGANSQRYRADKEAAVAQSITDFLRNDLLAQASALKVSAQADAENRQGMDRTAVKPDPEMKVRTALDRAATRIAGKFEHQPEVEAAIRDTMGQVYLDLGLNREAQTQLERAVDLERRVLGPENPKTLKTSRFLGRAEYVRGLYSQAEKLYVQTLEIDRRVLGPEHPETLRAMNNLAIVYRGQHLYGKSEALARQTLEIRRRVMGLEHPDTLASMQNLAQDYYRQGEYPQAESLDTQSLEIKRRVMGAEHVLTLSYMRNLANVYFSEGKYEKAAALHNETLEGRRHVLGPEHPDTLSSLEDVADVYVAQGRFREAEALYAQSVEIKSRVLGPEDPSTLDSVLFLARTYTPQGKYAQAAALYRRLREVRLRVLGPRHKNTIYCLTDLAVVYGRQGNLALARTYAEQALAEQRQALGPAHIDTLDTIADLALYCQLQGKFPESETLARQALESNRTVRPDNWRRFQAESLLGASLAGQKRYLEAEPLLLHGYQGMLARKDKRDIPDAYYLDRAREGIVRLYQTSGKPKEAAKWRKS